MIIIYYNNVFKLLFMKRCMGIKDIASKTVRFLFLGASLFMLTQCSGSPQVRRVPSPVSKKQNVSVEWLEDYFEVNGYILGGINYEGVRNDSLFGRKRETYEPIVKGGETGFWVDSHTGRFYCEIYDRDNDGNLNSRDGDRWKLPRGNFKELDYDGNPTSPISPPVLVVPHKIEPGSENNKENQ